MSKRRNYQDPEDQILSKDESDRFEAAIKQADKDITKMKSPKFTFTLKWYLLFSLIALSLIGTIPTGLYPMVWVGDMTKLSFVILGLFIFGTLKCGKDIRMLESTQIIRKRDLDFGWFLSETLLALGMVGTLVGFIVVMKDFVTLDFSNVSSVKDLIKNLGYGTSTALYTTLVGLVTSIFLKTQYFLFEDAIAFVEQDKIE